jgi:hypothetical protein
MKLNSLHARASLVALGVAFAVHAAGVAAQPPAGQGRPDAEFVNGGVTKEDADYLRAQAPSYPLEIVFSRSTSAGNAFAADVNVVVRDAQGATVLSIPSAEPIVLANLAPGRYTVEATYEGRTRSAEVTLGSGHQKLGFSW